MTDGLPLFDWTPPEDKPSVVIAFPLHRRMSKVRDVAEKLATKRTDRHIEQYRIQVTDALRGQLIRYGIDADQIERELDRFWQAVTVESTRRRNTERKGPGAA